MQDLLGRSCRDGGPVSLSSSRGLLSTLEGHGRDELLHLVGQPLLPRLLILVQGCCDLGEKENSCEENDIFLHLVEPVLLGSFMDIT